MGSIAAAILTIAKAVPAAERLLAQVVDLYSTWKRQQNARNEADKNARNADLIAGAAAGARLLGTCPTCGAPCHPYGQYRPLVETSPIPESGSVSS